jgi:hypothetical protein
MVNYNYMSIYHIKKIKIKSFEPEPIAIETNQEEEFVESVIKLHQLKYITVQRIQDLISHFPNLEKKPNAVIGLEKALQILLKNH